MKQEKGGMKQLMKTRWLVGGCFCVLNFAFCISTTAFEGRIHAVMTRGNETNALLYTVGTNSLRVEMTATNWPNPVDILDRNSGELTLLFPNNRSYVHLKSATDAVTAPTPGMAGMLMPPGGLPPGIGPQSGPVAPAMPAMPPRPAMPARPQPPGGLPPGVGPQTPAGPGAVGMPAMPGMPMPMMPGTMEKMELQATGQATNLLGFACQRYELKQRGETLEIWATDQLLPYQPYVQNQPHHFGPRRIEEQWPELVKARKLFPLLAVLHSDHGPERFRFEVQSVTPQKLTDDDAKLFQPPAGWMEIQPLPF
jgi:Domain of unknown function (DUF4412)